MILRDLISRLEGLPADMVFCVGLGRPHSYRGYYDQLAFEPEKNVSVAKMIERAKSAVGDTFMGWRGGEYTMSEWTETWLAEYGCCGSEITPAWIDCQVENVALRDRAERAEAALKNAAEELRSIVSPSLEAALRERVRVLEEALRYEVEQPDAPKACYCSECMRPRLQAALAGTGADHAKPQPFVRRNCIPLTDAAPLWQDQIGPDDEGDQ